MMYDAHCCVHCTLYTILHIYTQIHTSGSLVLGTECKSYNQRRSAEFLQLAKLLGILDEAREQREGRHHVSHNVPQRVWGPTGTYSFEHGTIITIATLLFYQNHPTTLYYLYHSITLVASSTNQCTSAYY